MLIHTQDSQVSHVSRTPEERAASICTMLKNMLPQGMDLPEVEAILRVLRVQVAYQLRMAVEQERAGR